MNITVYAASSGQVPDKYIDMARQLGAVPAKGSIADKAMAAAFNTKTATIRKLKSLRN